DLPSSSTAAARRRRPPATSASPAGDVGRRAKRPSLSTATAPCDIGGTPPDGAGSPIPSTEPSVSDLRANRRGILALVAGMATFTVNDALVKFVARSYPFGEVIFVRGVMAVVLVGAILFGRGPV